MRVTILGAGVIGGAFARALLRHQVVTSETLFLIEKDEHRCNAIRKELGCYGAGSIYPNISESDVILCAVKPQDFQSIGDDLRKYLHKSQLCLSIMAGTSLATLRKTLGNEVSIARGMPNLPMTIEKGITPYYISAECDQTKIKLVERILSVCGETLRVSNEDLMDAATAVSGSGPGYVFYLMEPYLRAAQSLGFSEEEAKKLVCETLKGTAELFIKSDVGASELRAQVTSKGGTTEAGIRELDSKAVQQTFETAIRKAFERAQELRK